MDLSDFLRTSLAVMAAPAEATGLYGSSWGRFTFLAVATAARATAISGAASPRTEHDHAVGEHKIPVSEGHARVMLAKAQRRLRRIM